MVLSVPGFGLPVEYEARFKYPSAVRGDWESDGITLREQRMMAFINDITDKPEWGRKVFDDDIVAKWRAEANVQPEELEGDVVLSQQMFDFCIEELRDKAAIFKETGFIKVLDAELAIIKSDTVVSDSVKKALSEGVRALEDVPERLKDWHPGSDGKVLDLVHPSLFPVAYGLTKALPDGKVPLDGCLQYIGKGVTIDDYEPNSYGPLVEERVPYGSFQWLPTDVKISESGAQMQGYINNLHPEKHRSLYKVLEDIVAATVPLWEECLGSFHKQERIVVTEAGRSDWKFNGLKYRIPDVEDGPFAWYDPETELIGDGSCEVELWRHDFVDEDDYRDWEVAHRILTYPEPREYISQAELKENAVKKPGHDYSKPRLPDDIQVIFKLANIHLTPEKPTYEGGTWHVEGGGNETICASAIYYLDQDNITDSHLSFRQSLDANNLVAIPEQGEHDSLEMYYGVEQEGPAVQDLGRVLTREGRLLVFPNCVQHRVQPFSLQDETKPGHRKILAMFLIDPNRRVLSTSNVPPQRRDWWAEELHLQKALAGLPVELVQNIVDLTDDFPVSWEKATQMREKLMSERGFENERITRGMFSNTFSFCEH